MVNSIWKDYPKMGKRLDKTTEFIHNSVDMRNEAIAKMIRDLTSGGKMLRPAFFLLFSGFGPDKKSDQELIPLSASLELLHVATLIHDDVIDDSPLRRSKPTIHTKYGKRNAIYAGDYLFTIYFETISRHLPKQSDILINALSMKKILIGELDQLLINFNVHATAKMYFREVAGKTAELFSLSTMMGAIVSGGDHELIARSKNIGHEIGMSFQIMDDVLDFGDSRDTGKPNFEDLRNGVYSLPYILGLQDNNQALITVLSKDELSADDINEAARIVVDEGYLDQAKDIARTFSSHAMKRIKKLPRGTNRRALEKIVEELLDRIE
ncbi:polyprenyl synthetase family protein [Companilactobacillus sp.]|jgi:heptaprenyl diphosphate synthase|uniref:polyprenyl synthetase family protein n=1 Tax=Companilactobacillus sp. TaxID=2767905 RepID=UPI0025C729F5|nr:polyprenyl synthetase family protein [Companilactobacillus sp.]MCH4009365.1 polyprenyl synthetase family protein [Companilactobacillus sp.]MCH4050456.1 polyprenyl synthetase family protein [Companilactobacillus sp.]MCH4077307.1 polyprenyl synthetase family protein [Companilactobacillus sp.]MCH4125883.1 polyprenyl synthetase family protein [Companilactobacillus sp.]MCI1311592.1 polyprenyl synthetase family protein [Companilactobacillus sp.]